MMRKAMIERKTKETQIKAELDLDGTGESGIETGIGFLTHMLESFACASMFDVKIQAKGDLDVDQHHTVEDTGIALGQAFSQALGDKAGIARYGTAILPMDDVLALVSRDLSGRYAFVAEMDFDREMVGDLPTELIYDFLDAFAQNARLALHVRFLSRGRNDHHRAEAIFKALGMALRQAAGIDQRRAGIPSTKGTLE